MKVNISCLWASSIELGDIELNAVSNPFWTRRLKLCDVDGNLTELTIFAHSHDALKIQSERLEGQEPTIPIHDTSMPDYHDVGGSD
jgi:hypothetical protein